jgi:hypothetical protein
MTITPTPREVSELFHARYNLSDLSFYYQYTAPRGGAARGRDKLSSITPTSIELTILSGIHEVFTVPVPADPIRRGWYVSGRFDYRGVSYSLHCQISTLMRRGRACAGVMADIAIAPACMAQAAGL